MMASMFQLTGAILLGVMVAVRQSNEIYKYVSIIVPIKGEVHPKILDIYKETYLFRAGLLYISLGYFLQIAGFDITYISTLPWFSRLFITVIFVIVFCYVAKVVTYGFAKRTFNKTRPFDPYGGSHDNGSIMIEK